MNDDIIEALENTAFSRKAGDPLHSGCADRQDVLNWRRRLLSFFESLDGDTTVDDIKTALEDYS
jgi:hypothetical protein